MIFSGTEIAQIVNGLQATANGILFKETSLPEVYAVNIIDGTKRHVSAAQATVMSAAKLVPLVVPDGSLAAFTTTP